MLPAPAICPDAVLVQPLSPHAWRVRLPNGHELVGVIRKIDRPAAAGLVSGDVVSVEIVPADFSRGRLRPGGPAGGGAGGGRVG